MIPKTVDTTPEWIEARRKIDIENKINPFQGAYYEERMKAEKAAKAEKK